MQKRFSHCALSLQLESTTTHENVLRNPLDKACCIALLYRQHFIFDIFRLHASSEDGGNGEILPVCGKCVRQQCDCLNRTRNNARLGSIAAIVHPGDIPCWTRSRTFREVYAFAPGATSGANPQVKKCKRGKGTMLTPNLRRSELS